MIDTNYTMPGLLNEARDYLDDLARGLKKLDEIPVRSLAQAVSDLQTFAREARRAVEECRALEADRTRRVQSPGSDETQEQHFERITTPAKGAA